jgi:succinate dehydrogenase / fumarate reductase flavoprotein subunit
LRREVADDLRELRRRGGRELRGESKCGGGRRPDALCDVRESADVFRNRLEQLRRRRSPENLKLQLNRRPSRLSRTPPSPRTPSVTWIKRKIPNAEQFIIKKLPSMYHQFKQLADIDITKEPMEVGPTTHYIMGGVLVDAESQVTTVPGLFAAGECGAGLHGANRLGGNSLSDLLVFGKRAGAFAASFAKEQAFGRIDDRQIDIASRSALEPFDTGTSSGAQAESPYQIQEELQAMMQDLVGIVRTQADMARALEGIARMRERARRICVTGNRQYNSGWHTALALRNMFVVAEAITRSALDRRESRGAHFRDDFPRPDAAQGRFNLVVGKDSGGGMRVRQAPIPVMRSDLQKVIEEMK